MLLKNNLVAKVSQGARRYALISNVEENEEDSYVHFSIMKRTDNTSLATFDLPRGKYEIEGMGEEIIGTKFPLVSPRLKIVMWRMPEDVINSRYRITAIDLQQKPTFFIDNIDFLSIPPTIFKNWAMDQSYVLFNSNEDKLLLVRRTADGHDVSLMTDRGDILMKYLFTADIPIFLVKDMIITVSYQMENKQWRRRYQSERYFNHAVINTYSRLKIWYTQNMTAPIPIYDNTFAPDIEDYKLSNIGDVYTGTDNSIMLTLIYKNIDNTDIHKYIYRKYNIRSYQNMPEFFEDK